MMMEMDMGVSPAVEDSMGVVVSAPDGYTTPADNDGNGTPDFLEVGTEAMITLHRMICTCMMREIV